MAKKHVAISALVPLLVGGAIAVVMSILFACLVPILKCPEYFNEMTGEHEYGGTPEPTCVYCRDSGKVTVLTRWIWMRERRAIENDPRAAHAPER